MTVVHPFTVNWCHRERQGLGFSISFQRSRREQLLYRSSKDVYGSWNFEERKLWLEMKMILAPTGIYNLEGEDQRIQKQRCEGCGWEYRTTKAVHANWSIGALVWAVSKFQHLLRQRAVRMFMDYFWSRQAFQPPLTFHLISQHHPVLTPVTYWVSNSPSAKIPNQT